MEGSSHLEASSSSEQNSEYDSQKKEQQPPAATKINIFSHTGTVTTLSPKPKSPRDHLEQPPDEGPNISNDKTDGCNNDHQNQKGKSDSESSQAFLIYDYDTLDTSHEDTKLHQSAHTLETISRIDSTPLVGEQSSCSSESHTAPFVAPLFRDDITSHKSSEANDCALPLLKPLSKEENILKPLIRPVLSTNIRTEQSDWVTDHPTTSQSRVQECLRHHLQTDPPKEITLQPPSFTRILSTSQTSKVLQSDYHKGGHTPPPSYQESLSYPVIQHQPLPDYATTVGIGPRSKSKQKDPVVSIIRLSPPVAQTTAVASPVTRENVYVWHSPSDELCGRQSRVQDQYSDHQILALLACIMFWPIGLLAIYYANMANILRSEGVHGKSLIYSKRALLLSLVSFLIGTAVYLAFYLQRQIAL